jgi:hypothetical protein
MVIQTLIVKMRGHADNRENTRGRGLVRARFDRARDPR